MTRRSEWFHWQHGWYFRRGEKGKVQVRISRHGQNQMEVVIDAASWASIVAHVSKKGDTAPQVSRAEELHG